LANEVLHGGKVFKNEDYRKEELIRGGISSTYKE
jgi:hypothetical protein